VTLKKKKKTCKGKENLKKYMNSYADYVRENRDIHKSLCLISLLSKRNNEDTYNLIKT